MRKITLVLAFLLAQSMALGASQPTPVSGHFVPKTPMDWLTLRLRNQLAQINRETRQGKLTVAQAKTLKGQVEAIRQQEIADLKQNGSKTLTDDQVNQLNVQLNNLSKSIPYK